MHILQCALGPEDFSKVSSCDNAKEIWDKLEIVHEGTNEVKETKIGLLNLNYENFKMDPNEDIKAIGNPGEKLVRKLIYSLSESWDSKKTAIIEAKNLKELKLYELIGSLLTHELMSKPLIRDNEKKIKEQGINVYAIALKSSKCQYEDSSMEESSEEEDEEMEYLVKNFTRFIFFLFFDSCLDFSFSLFMNRVKFNLHTGLIKTAFTLNLHTGLIKTAFWPF
ncbi:hypothetical protein GQ457_04G021000 [Hibiscus cannabinus]